MSKTIVVQFYDKANTEAGAYEKAHAALVQEIAKGDGVVVIPEGMMFVCALDLPPAAVSVQK